MTSRNTNPVALAVVLASTAASTSAAQHLGDIGIAVRDGRIVTTEVTPEGPGTGRRAFGTVLGEGGVPWFTDEPGFDGEPGTFKTPSRIGFRFTAPLAVWNGTAFVPTDPSGPLAGERLRMSYLTLSATSGGGDAAGFSLAVAPDGGWHRHFGYALLPAAGAAEPDPGVYLARLALSSDDPEVEPSAEFWLVLDAGSTGDDFTDAFAAAEAATGCPADLNHDGAVDGADLGLLLGAWGGGGAMDLNRDGSVDGADLGLVLGAWGPCG